MICFVLDSTFKKKRKFYFSQINDLTFSEVIFTYQKFKMKKGHIHDSKVYFIGDQAYGNYEGTHR